MLKIGVIGYGYWGPNLVRNFMAADGATVSYVSDLDAARLELVSKQYPGVGTTTDHRQLVESPDVDAVAIATPVATHHGLATLALEAGKHVFVEKPLAASTAEAEDLVNRARASGLTLMVDHTFIYTGAVRKMRELVESGELGEIYYFDSVRVNLGLFQADVSVLWDLAVHDLAILGYVLPGLPETVSATGKAHVPGKPANVAYLTCMYPGSLIAHIHVNWLSPVKIRQTLLGGSRKMLVYDDLQASEKVKIYDRGITTETRNEIYDTLIGYRMGDMLAPRLDAREALLLEAENFVRCVRDRVTPPNDGLAGLQVVRLLEAAERSMLEHGMPVSV
ncbi:MAG: Gfo/Idh/MocA family oxidoreductase [Pseudomonadota bacterium]